MLIRVVKLTFDPEKVVDFLRIFEQYKSEIRQTKGCHHLELWRDKQQENVFFTYSYWTNENSLDQYRHSDTFLKVWPSIKALFIEKPEAWSLKQQAIIP